MTTPLKSIRTPWTDILRAQGASPAVKERIMAELMEKYYEPVQVFISRLDNVQRLGATEDLTQGYFTKFLEKDFFSRLNPDAGRFRYFLQTTIRHYVYDEWGRGGKRVPDSPLMRRPLPLPDEHIIPDKTVPTPEEEFNRCWARGLIADAVTVFKADCEENDRGNYWQAFVRHILEPETYHRPTYAETATHLGVSAKDVDNYVSRARKRFAAKLREVIRATVAEDRDVDDELAELQRYFL